MGYRLNIINHGNLLQICKYNVSIKPIFIVFEDPHWFDTLDLAWEVNEI